MRKNCLVLLTFNVLTPFLLFSQAPQGLNIEECVNIYNTTEWIQLEDECNFQAQAGDSTLQIAQGTTIPISGNTPKGPVTWSEITNFDPSTNTPATPGTFSDPSTASTSFTAASANAMYRLEYAVDDDCGTAKDRVDVFNFDNVDEFLFAFANTIYLSLNSVLTGDYWNLSLLSSDEAFVPQRGADWVDGGKWIALHQHTWSSDDALIPELASVWNGNINGIFQANEFLAQVDTATSAALQAQFRAEVRVLRALFYYQLMDLYGGVPIVTDIKENVPELPARNTRTEVFDFIIAELDAARLDLPTADPAIDWRISQEVVDAFQARLYMNAEVYTGIPQNSAAITNADDVINSGIHSLAVNYFDNFSTNNSSASTENIFVVRFDELQNTFFAPIMPHPQLKSLHYNAFAPGITSNDPSPATGTPWNGFTTIADFLNKFDDSGDVFDGDNFLTSDSRAGDITNPMLHLGFLVGPQQDSIGNPITWRDGTTPLDYTISVGLSPDEGEGAGARVAKYEPNGFISASNDFVIFRLAEILLIKAEALERTMGPNDPTALTLVNQIRSRAGLGALATLDLDDILDERARELYWEGTRRQDLIRFGQFTGEWTNKTAAQGATTGQAFVELFPIPQSVLDVEPNLVQNPGY